MCPRNQVDPEVSVRSVSGTPKRIAVSSDGGDQPVWRRDKAELFFIDPQGQLQSVAVQWSREGSPTFGLPVAMNVPPIGRGHWGTPYDVSPTGAASTSCAATTIRCPVKSMW